MILFCYASDLTGEQLHDIEQLVEECRIYEGLTLGLPDLSDEDTEIYFFYESKEKKSPKSVLIAYAYEEYAELTAFTHPDCRCRGMFTSLFERFLSSHDELPICFYPDGNSYDALATLTALDCEYNGTEHMLECELSPGKFYADPSCSLAVCDDISLLSNIHSKAFNLSPDESKVFLESALEDGAVAWLITYENEPAGLCLGTANENSVYLFGFCILPTLWNRHIGTKGMQVLLDCLSDVYKTAKVQVTEENEAAYHLYINLDFKGDEELMEYWY